MVSHRARLRVQVHSISRPISSCVSIALWDSSSSSSSRCAVIWATCSTWWLDVIIRPLTATHVRLATNAGERKTSVGDIVSEAISSSSAATARASCETSVHSDWKVRAQNWSSTQSALFSVLPANDGAAPASVSLFAAGQHRDLLSVHPPRRHCRRYHAPADCLDYSRRRRWRLQWRHRLCHLQPRLCRERTTSTSRDINDLSL